MKPTKSVFRASAVYRDWNKGPLAFSKIAITFLELFVPTLISDFPLARGYQKESSKNKTFSCLKPCCFSYSPGILGQVFQNNR